MKNEELDFVEDFDISRLEQSNFTTSRWLVQKSGLIAKIGPTSYTTYCVLRSFVNPVTGVAWPGNDTLGDILNRKHDTVGRSIDELAKAKLLYVDTPPGGPKTRGIRLIDWLPAHIFTESGQVGRIVKGKVAVPYFPRYEHALLTIAREVAASPIPQVAIRDAVQKTGTITGDMDFDFIRYVLDGEWVLALAPGVEKISRSFFIAAGVPFDAVTEFYAQKRDAQALDEQKRRAALLAQQDFDLYD